MKAFIFDFDGVIVDSERHWRTLGDGVFYPSLVEGWNVGDGATMMGLGSQAGYQLLVDDYGLKLSYEEYENRKQALMTDIYMSKLQPLPGLHGLLDRLSALQIPLAIGSSSTQHWIESTLVRLNLFKYFPIICSSTDVGERTKPLPDVYLLAASRLNAAPEACVVLEDSTNGIKAAKAANMICIAIRTDMNPEQDLSEADREVRHYDELTIEILKTI